jgi:ligand-binding SRPBCC domain-containing protein
VQFVKESTFSVPASELWAFHERPDAFTLLTPPWQQTEIVQPPASLRVGTLVKLRAKVSPIPFWQEIEAEHVEYDEGRMFADRMNKGPFAQWLHRHIITAESASTSRLTDSIEYTLPLGFIGKLFGSGIAHSQLERLFAFRHEVTRQALAGEL